MQAPIREYSYQFERNKSMPSKLHSIVQANLIFQLNLNFRDRFRVFSELTLALSGWESVPDICLFDMEKVDFWHDEIQITTPPLCSIEILSPTQSIQELITKSEKYFQLGIKSCWLVIPSLKNIYVFHQPTEYSIFRENEVLNDQNLNISFNLSEVFR
jgi:Uma2 family endonuclease